MSQITSGVLPVPTLNLSRRGRVMLLDSLTRFEADPERRKRLQGLLTSPEDHGPWIAGLPKVQANLSVELEPEDVQLLTQALDGHSIPPHPDYTLERLVRDHLHRGLNRYRLERSDERLDFSEGLLRRCDIVCKGLMPAGTAEQLCRLLETFRDEHFPAVAHSPQHIDWSQRGSRIAIAIAEPSLADLVPGLGAKLDQLPDRPYIEIEIHRPQPGSRP